MRVSDPPPEVESATERRGWFALEEHGRKSAVEINRKGIILPNDRPPPEIAYAGQVKIGIALVANRRVRQED